MILLTPAEARERLRMGRNQFYEVIKRREIAVILSDATISLYLNGIRSFSPDTAMRVSAKTGIPLEALFQ